MSKDRQADGCGWIDLRMSREYGDLMSEKCAAQVTVSTPGSYAIVVAGAIDASWADHFDGLRFDTETLGETRLVGSLPDQAALQGVLERLYALSLPILSVVRLHDDVTTEEEPNA